MICALSFSLAQPARPWKVELFEGGGLSVRFAEDVRFIGAEGCTMSLDDRSAPGGRRHVVRFANVVAHWSGDVLELRGE